MRPGPGCNSDMQYRSTRGASPVGLDEALVSGIASDGGLFLPCELPRFESDVFSAARSLQDTAAIYLQPFFEGSALREDLNDIVDETFRFPIPVTELPVDEGYCGILELFHGPTAAFKDVGAGFLAACLSRLEGDPDNPLTILVATSGDTGGAVAAAFDARPGMRVAVLYPDGRVSERQAHQLTCWSDNVLSLAVQGSFDDCQALVKGAMADPDLSSRHRFSSANSINIGRLLPQGIYYAHAALTHQRNTGRRPSFIVPTGNLGNAFACYMARETGLPIGDLLLATNANRIIVDYLDGSEWSPRKSIQTLASAMDVGNPSNMERLRAHAGDAADLARQVRGISVDDRQIEDEIRRTFAEFGIAPCPHTATAIFAWRGLSHEEKIGKDWILAATAHAAKFEQIVEPIIGEAVAIPDELADILSRERRFLEIEPTMAALAEALDTGFRDAAAR
jgi:threonine synthase